MAQTVGKDMRREGGNKEVGRKKNSAQHKPHVIPALSLSFPTPLCHSRGGGNPVLNSYATHNFTLTNAKRLQKRGAVQ